MKFPAQMSLGRKKRRAEEAVLEQHSFAYSTVSEIKPGIQRNVEIPPPPRILKQHGNGLIEVLHFIHRGPI